MTHRLSLSLTVLTRYGPDLSCQPLSCGSPTSSQHAEVRPECTRFRCQATITCRPGYTVREGSPATKICQADGTWSQANIDCVPIHCPLPENPINGKALFLSTNFESVVNYEETFLNLQTVLSPPSVLELKQKEMN